MKEFSFLFFLSIFLCWICYASCDEFAQYKHIYLRNSHMYEHFLSSDQPLTDLGRLHLNGLKMLIDIRLGNKRDVYLDSNEIYEIMYGDEYLEKEWLIRYGIQSP